MKIAKTSARRKPAPSCISSSPTDDYAVIWLRRRFGLVPQRATVIAALAGLGARQ